MSLILVLTSLALGCASPPAPQAPHAANDAPKAASQPHEPASDAAADEGASERSAQTETAPAEVDPRADGLRKPSRPPADLITGPNLLYVFNFGDSEVVRAARERCETETDTPAQRGACLEKARSKVPVESIRFMKNMDSGEYWWVTYNRYKGNLLKWHRVQFLVGDETSDRVTLKLVGKDLGIAPMARVPRALEIELPNDYTIVVVDPELGKMSYDAKIGALEND